MGRFVSNVEKNTVYFDCSDCSLFNICPDNQCSKADYCGTAIDGVTLLGNIIVGQ